MWMLILFGNLMQMPQYKKLFSKYYTQRKRPTTSASGKSEELVTFDCTFKGAVVVVT